MVSARQYTIRRRAFILLYFWAMCMCCMWHRSEGESVDIALLQPIYQELEKQALNNEPNRRELVLQALSRAAGVYENANRSAKLPANSRILNTVVIQVIEQLGRGTIQEENYKQQLLNFLCYSKQLQLKSLLYVITKNFTEFARKKEFFEAFSPYVHVLPFPYATFWRFVAAKRSNITIGAGRGDYNDTSPSFHHFGALPMLVPVYEALQLGYNALYLDIDIVFTHDPIPFLTAGTADLVIAPELKNCVTMPSLGLFSRWATLEPHTGTLFVASSELSIRYMEGWFRRIIQDNAMNDQRTMNLKDLLVSVDCRQLSSSPHRQPSKVSEALSFCFLNEFLFFTGLMEVFCNRGKKGGSVPRHFLAMAQLSLGISRAELRALHSKLNGSSVFSRMQQYDAAAADFDLYSLLAHDFHTHPYPNVHFPLAFHANYCGVKQRCFADRRLWLYDSYTHGCSAFRLDQTAYATHNWTEQMQHAQQALLHALQHTLYNSSTSASKYSPQSRDHLERRQFFAHKLDGLLVRFQKEATIFRMEGGLLRPFNNMQSLLHSLGGQLHIENIEVWHGSVLHGIPVGKAI